MSDIVERVRKQFNRVGFGLVAHEAADEIVRLRAVREAIQKRDAEIERLRRDLEIWRRNGGDDLQRAEVERLRAERDGLRTELEYVVRYFQGGIRPTDLGAWWRRACDALQRSRTERQQPSPTSPNAGQPDQGVNPP